MVLAIIIFVIFALAIWALNNDGAIDTLHDILNINNRKD